MRGDTRGNNMALPVADLDAARTELTMAFASEGIRW